AIEKARRSVFGDQSKPLIASSKAVTCRGKPPSTGIVQICGEPLRLDTNAIRLPSGEKRGELAKPILAMAPTAAVSSADGPSTTGAAAFGASAANPGAAETATRMTASFARIRAPSGEVSSIRERSARGRHEVRAG